MDIISVALSWLCIAAPLWLPLLTWPLQRSIGDRTFRITRGLWIAVTVLAVLSSGDRNPYQWEWACIWMAASAFTAATWIARWVMAPAGRAARFRKHFTIASLCAATLFVSLTGTFTVMAALHVKSRHDIEKLKDHYAQAAPAELRTVLQSGHAQEVELAAEELSTRGPSIESKLLAARTFADQHLPAQTRHVVGYHFFHVSGSMSEQVLPIIAAVLDDPNREMQLSAAWLICESAHSAPPAFDIWYGGYNERFEPLYRDHVPQVRAWWQSRRFQNKAGDPMTGPPAANNPTSRP